LQEKNILTRKIKPLLTDHLLRGAPTFLWQTATPIIVGWFAGHK